MLMKIYKSFDIVTVHFPFTDTENTKVRPALVISSDKYFSKELNHSILAMITSAQHSSWPLDLKIGDLNLCGLEKPSIIRLKIFTLDHRLIIDKIGRLSNKDQKAFQDNIHLALNDILQPV